MVNSGIRKLEFIDGVMTAMSYINVLQQNLQDRARKLSLQDRCIFQQDNDRKHTAKITTEWLLYNVCQQLKPHHNHKT